MGFDREKTTHHFYLHTDGGAIGVPSKDPSDKADLQAIRAHLPFEHVVRPLATSSAAELDEISRDFADLSRRSSATGGSSGTVLRQLRRSHAGKR
jgi:hypothetical protein